MSNSQQLFNSGRAHGQGQEKAEQWMESAKDTANTACDKMSSSAQSAQENKEQAAGFIQQTGEQVMHMAQSAADAVKNAVGMGNEGSGRSTSTTTTTSTTTRR